MSVGRAALPPKGVKSSCDLFTSFGVTLRAVAELTRVFCYIKQRVYEPVFNDFTYPFSSGLKSLAFCYNNSGLSSAAHSIKGKYVYVKVKVYVTF